VNIDHHRYRGISHSEAADLACGVELTLHHDRRHVQQVGDIVEAAACVVGG
jgi:hypothetical protein